MNYYDEHAESIAQPNARHQVVLSLVSAFVQPGMPVLDLGCGAGITTDGMRTMMGADAVGVDGSERLIEIAKERYGGEFHVGDITDLDADLGEFDAITLIDCIEHLENPDRVFDTIERYAKDSAWVYFNYPYPRYLDEVRETAPSLLQPVDNSIEYHWLAQEMFWLGFQPVMMQVYGIDVPLQYVSALFLRG